jgi:hypothetical protein
MNLFWAFEKAVSLFRAAVVAGHRLWRLLTSVHLLRAPAILECVSGEAIFCLRTLWNLDLSPFRADM